MEKNTVVHFRLSEVEKQRLDEIVKSTGRKIPELLRSFIQDAYNKEFPPYKRGFSFPKEFHLTLKFLGEVNEDKIEKIKDKLKEIKFKPFKARLSNLGVFPDKKHINVIWINLIPQDIIIKLQQSVEDVLEQFYEKEKREFKAHVTLTRVKFVKDKEKLLESLKKKIEGEFVIDKFKLIKSELTPEGAIYTVLGEYNGKKM